MDSVTLVDNNLEWNEPKHTCEVTDYTVEVVLVNIDQCEETDIPITKVIEEDPYMVLPPLKYFSTYKATIRARFGNTARGTGDPNTMEFKTGESGTCY